MPKTPIYVVAARRGAPSGHGPAAPERPRRAADARAGGFAFDRYIDIFDGGPTVTAPTDQIRTIRDARTRDRRRNRRRRIGEDAGRDRPAEGFPRLLRVGQEAAEEGQSRSTARRAELLEVEVGRRVG